MNLANPSFTVFSKLDNRTLEGKADGSAHMQTYDPTNSKQIWIKSDLGDQWINTGTYQPLMAGNGRNWIIGSKNGNGYLILDQREPTKALDRGWKQANGQGLTTWQAHGAVNQRWNFVYFDENSEY